MVPRDVPPRTPFNRAPDKIGYSKRSEDNYDIFAPMCGCMETGDYLSEHPKWPNIEIGAISQAREERLF
jgi:hypothetical protein